MKSSILFRALGVPDLLTAENQPIAATKRLMEAYEQREGTRGYMPDQLEAITAKVIAGSIKALEAGQLDPYLGEYGDKSGAQTAITLPYNEASGNELNVCEGMVGIVLERLKGFVDRYPNGFSLPVLTPEPVPNTGQS